jgi:hypothetical protein
MRAVLQGISHPQKMDPKSVYRAIPIVIIVLAQKIKDALFASKAIIAKMEFVWNSATKVTTSTNKKRPAKAVPHPA